MTDLAKVVIDKTALGSDHVDTGGFGLVHEDKQQVLGQKISKSEKFDF